MIGAWKECCYFVSVGYKGDLRGRMQLTDNRLISLRVLSSIANWTWLERDSEGRGKESNDWIFCEENEICLYSTIIIS